MQAYRFAVGETVLYTEHRFPNLKWKTPFRILGLLPFEAGEPQHLVQSADLTCDRVASEHQLSRRPLPQKVGGRLDGRSLDVSRLDRHGSSIAAASAIAQRSGYHHG